MWAGASARPTLNELYRQFSVGLVRTLANEDLGPERLFGGEAGVRFETARNSSVRSTLYDNRVKNPVSNVTIGTNLQQRQNLGRTRIRGWQNDVEMRIGASLRVTGGYLFNNAKVTEFAANPALVGLYLPQVPKHRGSVGVTYSNPRYVTVAATGTFFGRQFDDDLNERTKPGETEPGLPPYGVLDFSASRDFGRNLQVFFGVQNTLRPGVLRHAPADDDRLAAPDQRRRPCALLRPMTSGPACVRLARDAAGRLSLLRSSSHDEREPAAQTRRV